MKKQKSLNYLDRKLITILLYIATFSVVVIYWRQPATAFVLLLAISIALNIVTRWRLINMYIITAILGCLAEIVCIKSGAWYYGNPQFLGIPYWLPLVWGNASVLFFELAEQFGHIQIAERKKRKR